MIKNALVSKCGMYRYWLARSWVRNPQVKDTVNFIMVNPSTADAEVDDATIRKCIGFANRWGFGQLIVTNVFAYRATDVTELESAADPEGPRNAFWLNALLPAAAQTIVAWGAVRKFPKGLGGRWTRIPDLAAKHKIPLTCLGIAKDGHPLHPLMLAYDTRRQDWSPPCS